jgi:hypothetical protein
MKYFPHEINGERELKKLYRQLSMRYHPDQGGTNEQFVEMQVEYEQLLRGFKDGWNEKSNRQLIDELWEHCRNHGWKKGWVYYKFMELARNATQADFKYIASLLGYKEQWAWYKWNDYNMKKV